MNIGIPKEIKRDEYRVAVTPAGVKELVSAGHKVLIESGAGDGSSISDAEYRAQGASVVSKPASVWERADLILKVKEPMEEEFSYFREELAIFTFLHLAAAKDLTKELLAKKVTAIGYETVAHWDGSLPLLTPMSEIAGRMAPHVAAYFLERMKGGRGTLLSGVPGVMPGKVVIIGAGVVGMNAAVIAQGIGAEVVVIDKSIERLTKLESMFFGRTRTLASTTLNIEQEVVTADVLIGAVLVPGAQAPHLVSKELVSAMLKGSVVVDVSVDQGGCIETSRPTTHSEPTYIKHGVVHYGVANMPGAVPRTSTYALTNSTLPWILKIAERGVQEAIVQDEALQAGVNTIAGKLTLKPVADQFKIPFTPLASVLPTERYRVI